ncbi:MAG TPA: signal peptidase I [Leptolyngbyaceae cyanobacterium M65_K2018_010]|nr:signal peptidase I [Leptolyngbyaceae cyanobacterium M65_K2018_010]
MSPKPPSSSSPLPPEAEPGPSSTLDRDSAPSSPGSPAAGWRANLRVLAIALVIALVVRVLIAEPRYIPSNSMDPTLQIGDRLLVDKLSYRWQPPHRGDIVVFKPPAQLVGLGYNGGQAFIKRIVGEPGDTLEVVDGQVRLNGQILAESYILAPPQYHLGPVTVPPGHLFVLGDNRNDSNDSHVWGPLPQANLIGRARFRFWPLDRFGQVG